MTALVGFLVDHPVWVTLWLVIVSAGRTVTIKRGDDDD